MYAVVNTGGKQYKVSKGDILRVEKLNGEVDSTIELTDVLAFKPEEGDLRFGTPLVDGVKVVCKVLKQDKAKKIVVFKYKAKKNYKKKQGHRQPFTQILVEDIIA
ncbi:MAG: 50S ribosomal protein L21 [Clostridium sp.]|nr:50S ribosomal protein L21 [Clostridium sp.]